MFPEVHGDGKQDVDLVLHKEVPESLINMELRVMMHRLDNIL